MGDLFASIDVSGDGHFGSEIPDLVDPSPTSFLRSNIDPSVFEDALRGQRFSAKQLVMDAVGGGRVYRKMTRQSNGVRAAFENAFPEVEARFGVSAYDAIQPSTVDESYAKQTLQRHFFTGGDVRQGHGPNDLQVLMRAVSAANPDMTPNESLASLIDPSLKGEDLYPAYEGDRNTTNVVGELAENVTELIFHGLGGGNAPKPISSVQVAVRGGAKSFADRRIYGSKSDDLVEVKLCGGQARDLVARVSKNYEGVSSWADSRPIGRRILSVFGCTPSQTDMQDYLPGWELLDPSSHQGELAIALDMVDRSGIPHHVYTSDDASRVIDLMQKPHLLYSRMHRDLRQYLRRSTAGLVDQLQRQMVSAPEFGYFDQLTPAYRESCPSRTHFLPSDTVILDFESSGNDIHRSSIFQAGLMYMNDGFPELEVLTVSNPINEDSLLEELRFKLAGKNVVSYGSFDSNLFRLRQLAWRMEPVEHETTNLMYWSRDVLSAGGVDRYRLVDAEYHLLDVLRREEVDGYGAAMDYSRYLESGSPMLLESSRHHCMLDVESAARLYLLKSESDQDGTSPKVYNIISEDAFYAGLEESVQAPF